MMQRSSYGQRFIEASLEGLPLALQGVGTIGKDLRVYGAGVAINGVVGLKQVIDEAQRHLRIHWDPDHIHPKPNYYKVGSGVINIAGAAVYGASSAGVLSPALGGAGALVQALSYYTTKLLPQDAGTYYPPLPVHRPVSPGAPHTPVAVPGRAAMSSVAAMRPAGYENPNRGTAKAREAHTPRVEHPYSRTTERGKRRHSL
ncbi:hypothetical protein [Streptomyces sp. NPDC088789]|uniref:hypothetical protein n=1 Tax=Streptomyces sp. NPDC088789 TaxID=3365899 RepID=UPI00381D3528